MCNFIKQNWTRYPTPFESVVIRHNQMILEILLSKKNVLVAYLQLLAWTNRWILLLYPSKPTWIACSSFLLMPIAMQRHRCRHF